MTTNEEFEIRNKVDTEPDYVNIRRYGYSLERLMERYPDGAPTNVVAQALYMTEEEVEEMYTDIVSRLRSMIFV